MDQDIGYETAISDIYPWQQRTKWIALLSFPYRLSILCLFGFGCNWNGHRSQAHDKHMALLYRKDTKNAKISQMISAETKLASEQHYRRLAGSEWMSIMFSNDLLNQAWPLGASYSQNNQQETEQSTVQCVMLSAWTQCWCVSQYWAAAYLYTTSAVFKLWYASVWLLYGTRAAFNGTFEEEIRGTPYIQYILGFNAQYQSLIMERFISSSSRFQMTKNAFLAAYHLI